MADGEASNLVPFPFWRLKWLADRLDDSGRENLDWEDNVVHLPFRPYDPVDEVGDDMQIEIVGEV